MKGKALMFHRVLPQALIKSPNAYWERGTLVSLEFFRSVLSELKRKKRNVWPLAEFWRRNALGVANENDAALTFDDGYLDNYAYVWPALMEFDMKATFFPVWEPCRTRSVLPIDQYYAALDGLGARWRDRPEYIDGPPKRSFLFGASEQQADVITMLRETEPTGEVPPPAYMTLNQLAEMREQGQEIGGHTLRHEMLTNMPTDTAREIVRENIALLKKSFGTGPFPFSYPDGRYNDEIKRQVKEAGFVCACTVEKQVSIPDAFCIPRLFVTHSFDLSRL